MIANSGSNNVWVLPGVGNGFFNDQSPTILPVGTNPSALFVGQFTTGSGQDLVTVNSGSDNLTVISGIGSASPVMQTISSGGIDPTAAFAVNLTAEWSGGPGGRQQRRRQHLAVSSPVTTGWPSHRCSHRPGFPIHPAWRWRASAAAISNSTRRTKAKHPPRCWDFSSKKGDGHPA